MSLASAAVLAVVGLRWEMVPVLVAVVVLPFTARTRMPRLCRRGLPIARVSEGFELLLRDAELFGEDRARP